MNVFGYALAGAVQGLGLALMKEGEDRKRKAEQEAKWAREDKIRAEDRAFKLSLKSRSGGGGSAGTSGGKLVGEEWIRRGDVEVLMGRTRSGTMRPYVDENGQPVTRPVQKEWKPLPGSILERIDNWALEQGLDEGVARKFAAEAERLMNEDGIPPMQALNDVMERAVRAPDETVKEGGIFGLGARERVVPGTYTGEIRPRGLATVGKAQPEEPHAVEAKPAVPARTPPKTPTIPAEPSGAAPAPGLPRISSEDEYKSLPSGTLFIAPDGTVRRKP